MYSESLQQHQSPIAPEIKHPEVFHKYEGRQKGLKQLFSTSGAIYDEKQNLLASEKVEMLLFIKIIFL